MEQITVGRAMIALWIWACSGQVERQQQELAKASEKVIFSSVETLGSHAYVAILRREEYRAGEKSSEHEENIAINWINWDRFSYQRMVDGKKVMNLIVVDRTPWLLRPNGKWEKRRDAEPYRVQMRSSWNAWEQLIAPFSTALSWQAIGEEELEGRVVMKYQISLDKDKLSKPKGLHPAALQGSVWVDQQTAVRLLADIKGTLKKPGYRKEISLRLSRTQVGKRMQIVPPEQEKKSGK